MWDKPSYSFVIAYLIVLSEGLFNCLLAGGVIMQQGSAGGGGGFFNLPNCLDKFKLFILHIVYCRNCMR